MPGRRHLWVLTPVPDGSVLPFPRGPFATGILRNSRSDPLLLLLPRTKPKRSPCFPSALRAYFVQFSLPTVIRRRVGLAALCPSLLLTSSLFTCEGAPSRPAYSLSFLVSPADEKTPRRLCSLLPPWRRRRIAADESSFGIVATPPPLLVVVPGTYRHIFSRVPRPRTKPYRRGPPTPPPAARGRRVRIWDRPSRGAYGSSR